MWMEWKHQWIAPIENWSGSKRMPSSSLQMSWNLVWWAVQILLITATNIENIYETAPLLSCRLSFPSKFAQVVQLNRPDFLAILTTSHALQNPIYRSFLIAVIPRKKIYSLKRKIASPLPFPHPLGPWEYSKKAWLVSGEEVFHYYMFGKFPRFPNELKHHLFLQFHHENQVSTFPFFFRKKKPLRHHLHMLQRTQTPTVQSNHK